MTLAIELSERTLAFGPEHMTDSLYAAARTAFIDTVGVTLLGSVQESAAIAMRIPGSCVAAGPATVLGTDVRTTTLDAAAVNGVASHALDFDDFTEDFGGHPSVPLIPALMALGEELDASWKQVATAYVAGVELETRIAHGVHFHHYQKGWHPTATLGVLGAAGACAHLMGLDPERTATALAIAASLASGLKANFGTMTKPLHVGHCTRSGLYAAYLAREGFTANTAALEHAQGFLEVYNGAGTFDTARMLVPWFEPPLVLEPGLSIKQFACCGSTHPAIFMALQLREEQGVRPEDVRAVTIATHPFRLPHTNHPFPATELEAKFSIQYAVARALTSGKVLLADFEAGAYQEPAIKRLLDVIQAGPDPEMALREERCFGAEVRVELESGEVRTARTEHMPGRGLINPMSEAELKDKFTDCAARALPAEQVDAAWEGLCSLSQQTSIRDLCTTLAATGAGATPRLQRV